MQNKSKFNQIISDITDLFPYTKIVGHTVKNGGIA